MARRDLYHDAAKHALQHDGWTITHDPFRIKIGDRHVEADLGAERLIRAEKGIRKIVVEVKSFLGPSAVHDLEEAFGQYMLYRRILDVNGIERELYLAVTYQTYQNVFTIPLGQIVLTPDGVHLMVFDHRQEEVVLWVPAEPTNR